MAFANVNIGTNPGDGTGDPLYTAFSKINQNFANIQNGNFNVTVNSPVQTVAGRTGNVVITLNDVVGANVAGQYYTMGNYTNWQGNVYTVAQALDQLAARLTSAGW